MKAVIQRVTQAQVRIEGNVVGSIGKGFLILLGVGQDDSEDQVEKLWSKIFRMRIFADETGKVLVVSQFTLYADCRRGNRPSFTKAGSPDSANTLYECFVERARRDVERVETGEFGADMQVSLQNDGPFTILLDTDEL